MRSLYYTWIDASVMRPTMEKSVQVNHNYSRVFFVLCFRFQRRREETEKKKTRVCSIRICNARSYYGFIRLDIHTHPRPVWTLNSFFASDTHLAFELNATACARARVRHASCYLTDSVWSAMCDAMCNREF